jgi:tetratricopeptide (TPR) repeat protein
MLWLCGVAGHAASFEEANKLYYEGKFPEAATAYEQLKQSGVKSPALYFNLGNALLKSGQPGRAILAYRAVERLTPRDPDVRANLQFARNQVQGPTIKPASWQISVAKLTLNEWTLLACGSVWLWLFIAAAWQWRSQWRRSLRGLLAGWGLASILICACFATALYENRFVQNAVVVAREAVVRHGPLQESQNAFTLHDGSEVRVLDRKDDWLFVTTDLRRAGWLRQDQVAMAPL